MLITNDLPETNFWFAWSSDCVKLSGSISLSAISECRYWSTCFHCGIEPVNWYFFAFASQVAFE